jgi:succinate dehydrogenase / fumarate reductase iron-sulfur subunit
MSEHDHHATHHEKTITVRVLRQDSPHDGSRWETFHVPHEEGMNVTTVLQRIAADPVTADHHHTTPVAYDVNCLEEVCGSCTMVINGRVRQGCSALVDNLLKESSELELRPMTKYPVVRDLVVDRKLMFERLKKIKAWVPVDGYHDLGVGPRVQPKVQEQAYPLSRCMTCGCCTEACPQFSDRSEFIGPMAVGQAILFNLHPTGQALEDERLAVLSGPGGITDCGNSQNCVKVCPKEVPLTEALARAGRDTTVYKVRKWFGR